jgi:hypothetical protein
MPAVSEPSTADQAARGDEGGGQSEEECHASPTAFSAAAKLAEVVHP